MRAKQLTAISFLTCQPVATLRQRSDSQSSQRSFQYPGSANGYYPQQQQQQASQPPQQQQQQVGGHTSAPSQQFSGWRGVVATVGTASAAGVAIFSEESMKSLKYCLQWLQYAVQHIDHQIGLLRAFLVSLASPSSSTAMVPSTAASTLASIKKEVVETLRKVIHVVSRYAGACLPDQAKISVRQFILSMPVRWATLNNESVPSTPMGSPSLGPQSDRSPEQQAALNETSERATKVLVLAHESSDMLKSVASIFKDSVDKAENWMD
ncbi:MAG: transcription factor Opi1, partial [Linnemannia elongata]